MKYMVSAVSHRLRRSPPSRGAWIEISVSPVRVVTCVVSPPSRGAWIEIVIMSEIWAIRAVAPLAGGVD